MHRYRDVALTLAYLTVAGIVLLLGVRTPVNAPLFAPLVLFVPGYSLVTALEQGDGETDWPRRLVLSVSLSTALVALSGLVLNIVGLDRTVWGVFLVAISLAGTAVTFARRTAREEHLAVRAGVGVDQSSRARTQDHVRSVVNAERALVGSVLFTTLLITAAVLLTETTARHASCSRSSRYLPFHRDQQTTEPRSCQFRTSPEAAKPSRSPCRPAVHSTSNGSQLVRTGPGPWLRALPRAASPSEPVTGYCTRPSFGESPGMTDTSPHSERRVSVVIPTVGRGRSTSRSSPRCCRTTRPARSSSSSTLSTRRRRSAWLTPEFESCQQEAVAAVTPRDRSELRQRAGTRWRCWTMTTTGTARSFVIR